MAILKFVLPVSMILFFSTTSLFAEQLTADYLAGPWCYSHSLSGNNREDEMKNFLFDKNGTFSYVKIRRPGLGFNR